MPDYEEYVVEVEETTVREYRYRAYVPLVPDAERLDTMVAGAARRGALIQHLEGEGTEVGPMRTRISAVRRDGRQVYPRREK